MERNILDRVIGFFSPRAELRRFQTRQALALQFRAYDAAKSTPTSEWSSAVKSGANSEISAALATLQNKSHDLARNNPINVRALNVIVSNVVGAGIVAQIKGKKSQVKKLNLLWKQVAESSLCDAEGRNNFYALQALAMRAIAESGENLAQKIIDIEAPKIRILESDFLVTKKYEDNVIQGVEFDNKGVRTKYHLYKKHPGEKGSTEETVIVRADSIAHAYKQDRPGQVRGVPWSTAVIESLKDLADYQMATIVAKKVAACFVGAITTNGNDSALSPADLKTRREAEMQMIPGTMRYLNPGEQMNFSSPPPSGGYAEFVREALRSIAAGYGISYEALTGDYSQVNFSSGRMGHIEFRRNIDYWRWNILIPQFCDPYFKWFLEWAQMQGVDTTGVTVAWVPPAHTMIDPSKEIEALKREVRAGFKTYGQAVREQGLDPDDTLTETAEWNQKFDDLKITLDVDPRRMAGVGFAHPKDTLPLFSDSEDLIAEVQPSEQTNEEDASEEPTASVD